MYLVLHKKINDKNMVSSIINLDVATDLPQEVIDSGVIVENEPSPEAVTGKTATIYIDLGTKKYYYEYADRPLTQDEEIADLKAKLKVTQDAIDATLLT
ncbi:hypothetical protein HPY27_24770 [Brevibacillus sp. HB1.1]|uniref:hypothetical protein n=1 Tax=Brevibacillus sp. HB1.1 TaxID=2738808 RepID=UPI00157763FC|nr:hypothetical protein [Brevibacillus sp. HB1.1]NTU33372.1 hypothetical protein [Brevibacillus sp. HB1.1]